MNKTNKQTRNRLIDAEKGLTTDRGRGVGGLGEKGEGIKQRKKLRHREQ